MNGYSLSRQYFDWAFENPTENNPTLTALYFFIVEINNRLGWKSEFTITSRECLEGIGVSSYKTYKSNFDKLIALGFIKMVKASKNQFQANVIALVKNTNADTNASTKALDNAITNTYTNTPDANVNALVKNTNADTNASTKHIPKQVQSTYQSDSHIHKTTNYKQQTIESIGEKPNRFLPPSKNDVIDLFMSMENLKPSEAEEVANSFYSHHSKNNWTGVEDWRELAQTWKLTAAPVTKKNFTPPTVVDAFEYFTTEKGLSLTDAQYRAEQFILFYESKDWKIGKNKMTNWKSAATRSLEWEDKRQNTGYKHPAAKHQQILETDKRF